MAACRLVILISGNGSNLQAIIDATADGELPAEISKVISNRHDAYGLKRASDAGIAVDVLDHSQFDSRASYDQALMQMMDACEPDLVVLAGFMRILSDGFIEHYQDRIINIHPSLLPALKGLNTHQRALDQGLEQHGASVHFVNKELDSGAVVLQAVVDIEADDDSEKLAARVLEQEHIIYPMALRWFAEGRLRCEDDTVFLDGTRLETPVIWKDQQLCY